MQPHYLKWIAIVSVLMLNAACADRLEIPNNKASTGSFLSKTTDKATANSADGDSYTGAMKDGKYAGRGALIKPNKDRYEGEFKLGFLDGVGIFVGANGDSYEGEFKNNIFHGDGRFETNAGDTFAGNFNQGSLEGEGKITRLDGSAYVGQIQNQRPNGTGSFTFSNGDVYVGGFQRGAFHGAGTLTHKEARDDGMREVKGVWKAGQFIDPKTAANPLAVESFIYDQPALLQVQIDSLKQRVPNQANMYFLGVAGDGGMEVFRREVQTVTKQFAQNFGTAGRSIMLVNSAESITELPMANQISMQRALDAIAKQMDKQNDILFLFMTSHGSVDHEFALQHSFADIKDLPAKALATMLERTGIRHKVIVISACYSGGFIDSLEDDHHLILTAARRDRASFGCATENNFTYFGRAFFKESLPKSSSFQDAFTRSKTLITEWETRDFAIAKKHKDYLEARRKRLNIPPPPINPVVEAVKTASQIANAVRNLVGDEGDTVVGDSQPSLPQMYVGKKIAPVLEDWWKAQVKK